EIDPGATATVVMVAGGYPGTYSKGSKIDGLYSPTNQSTFTFHAGTHSDEAGNILTNGGRVLGITGKGNNIKEAIAQAYERVNQISWKDYYYRKDIGQDILRYDEKIPM